PTRVPEAATPNIGAPARAHGALALAECRNDESRPHRGTEPAALRREGGTGPGLGAAQRPSAEVIRPVTDRSAQRMKRNSDLYPSPSDEQPQLAATSGPGRRVRGAQTRQVHRGERQ